MDLSTTYLGKKLRNPLVVSASTLCKSLDNLQRMQDAGASAVVLHSIFEEQIRQERQQFENYLNYGTESFAEALSYFPKPETFRSSADAYLDHVRKAKAALSIPVVASLNAASLGGWTDYARKLEEADADALELNIYFLPSDPNVGSAQIEQTYIDIMKAVKSSVKIPVAVKLSPFFTNTANMAKRLVDAGADGLVLFNRFYQPDVDLEALEVKPNLLLSSIQEQRLPLCWIGMLHGRVRADLAATTGIHSALDAVKFLLVGANVTMLCSTLFRNGIEHIRKIEQEMAQWMEAKEYASVEQMRGSLSQAQSADPTAFSRVQYMRTVKTANPAI